MNNLRNSQSRSRISSKIVFECIQESRWVPKGALPCARDESLQRTRRQIGPFLRGERRDAAASSFQRPLGDFRRHSAASHIPARGRPGRAKFERQVVRIVVAAGLRQTPSNPLSHRNGYCISNQNANESVALFYREAPRSSRSENPWRRSTASIVGVTTRPAVGSRTAGGDGIPNAEPAFKGGIASPVRPFPDLPSVQ